MLAGVRPDMLAGSWPGTAANAGVLAGPRADFVVGAAIARVFADDMTRTVTGVGVGAFAGEIVNVVAAVATASESTTPTPFEE